MEVTLGSIRHLPSLADDLERLPERPTAQSLVALLRSNDVTERDDALDGLAGLVDTAFGDDGTALGEEVRTCGGIPLLTWLLADACPEVVQTSLMILGNLSSDSVDANSTATKEVLLQCGGARAILSCVHTDDTGILLGACGCIMNLTYTREWSELAVEHGLHRRLESLLTHEESLVVRYASGALNNITRALSLHDLSDSALEAVKERSLEQQREEWLRQRATRRIAAACSTVPMWKRQQRHDRGVRRRQRAANLEVSDITDSWSWTSSSWGGSRANSRPSSAASSHASSTSFVSARSAPILSF